MKVLFLDIDGVLFVYSTYSFSPSACNNLNLILQQEPELKIVISSSWRKLGMDQVKRTLSANGIDVSRIIDATGEEDGERGVQVQAWLDRNPQVTSFVVLDDESDFSDMMDRLVQTNMYVGITSADVQKSLDILKKPC